MATTLVKQSERLHKRRTPLVVTPPKTHRLTFKEAYDSILENSQIKRVASGELETTQWNAALAHDIAAVNKFLDNFIEDLNKLCASKKRHVQRDTQFAIPIKWQDHPDCKERAEYLWDQFQRQLAETTRSILNNIKARTPYPSGQNRPDLCMPLSWVKAYHDPNRDKNGHFIAFQWADTPTQAVNRELVDWCYKSPDDFTRSMPQDVTNTLALLKETNYDYKPTILDGTLVSEYNVQMTEFPKDPALVLRLGWEERDLMVRYWKEPFNNAKGDPYNIIATPQMVISFAILCALLGFGGGNLAFRCDGWLCALGWIMMIAGFICGISGIVATVEICNTGSRTLKV